MLRDTLKDFVILPHRDKFGRRIVLLRVCHAQNSRFLRMSKSLDVKVYKDLGKQSFRFITQFVLFTPR